METFEPFVIHTCEQADNPERRTRGYAPAAAAPFAPFRMDDPFGLRNAIVPVFCQHTDGRMYGMGTAFHFDGFGRFLTADHVVDFVRAYKDRRPMLFLSMHAVIYGTISIPPDCFAPVEEIGSPMMDVRDPLNFSGRPKRVPSVDAALLRTGVIGPGARSPQTLRLNTGRATPQVGDIVLAVGFPELDLSEVDEARQSALLTEGMYGAYGRVVEIYPKGTSATHPTPVFAVESDWPSGMSGGPVFNVQGEVIGLVSRSLRATDDLPGTGFAVHFGLAGDIEQLTPPLDPDSLGWRLCWAVFDGEEGDTLSFHESEAHARAAAAGSRHGIVRAVSNRLGSNDYMLREPPL